MNSAPQFGASMYPVPSTQTPQAGLVGVLGTACREVVYESRGTVIEVTNTLTVGVAS